MTTSGASALAHYVSLWSLEPDGLPFATRHSWLLAVRQADKPCLLKLRKPESDEYLTAALLSYFGGDGAVRLIAGDGPAVLMERACGVVSLMDMAAAGGDDAAAAVLADTIGKLHTERNMPPPQGLTPLEEWFKPLFQQAPKLPQLAAIVPVTRALLAAPFAPAVLHGDLHHDNVVFDQRRGWLAIDPKGLWGERTYEVANLLRNPWPNAALVHDADRMGRMAAFYAGRLGTTPRRVLQFAAAHAGLSASWQLEDGGDPLFSLRVAEIALGLV